MIAAGAVFNDAVSNTAVQVSPGRAGLMSLRLINTTAAVAYLQVFNAPATSVTVGTTSAAFAVRLGANETISIDLGGLQMPNGIALAGTTTATGSTGAAISVLAVIS